MLEGHQLAISCPLLSPVTFPHMGHFPTSHPPPGSVSRDPPSLWPPSAMELPGRAGSCGGFQGPEDAARLGLGWDWGGDCCPLLSHCTAYHAAKAQGGRPEGDHCPLTPAALQEAGQTAVSVCKPSETIQILFLGQPPKNTSFCPPVSNPASP